MDAPCYIYKVGEMGAWLAVFRAEPVMVNWFGAVLIPAVAFIMYVFIYLFCILT